MGAPRIRLQSPRAVLLGHIALGRRRTEALSPQHWGVLRPLSSTPTAHRGQSSCFRIPPCPPPTYLCAETHTHRATVTHMHTRTWTLAPSPWDRLQETLSCPSLFHFSFFLNLLWGSCWRLGVLLSLTRSRPHPFPRTPNFSGNLENRRWDHKQ